MSSTLNVGLCKRQFRSLGDREHGQDQIDSRRGFGDGVLHLQASVHLQEVEISLRVEQVLEGARGEVAERTCAFDAGPAHPFGQLRREHRARCFLDDLLVPTLHRTVALEQMDDVAVLVAEDLDFDVPGGFEVLFQVHGAIGEGTQSFLARAFPLQLGLGFAVTRRMPLPPPPATGLSMMG